MKKLFLILVTLAAMGASQIYAADPHSEKPVASSEQKFKNVGPAQFDQLRQKGTNVVLDVRTEREYKLGHIPGSVLIDFNSPDFETQLKKLDKSKTYLVHCASGGRSAQACTKMESLNFTNVYNLEGGIRAWKKEGKPVEK